MFSAAWPRGGDCRLILDIIIVCLFDVVIDTLRLLLVPRAQMDTRTGQTWFSVGKSWEISATANQRTKQALPSERMNRAQKNITHINFNMRVFTNFGYLSNFRNDSAGTTTKCNLHAYFPRQPIDKSENTHQSRGPREAVMACAECVCKLRVRSGTVVQKVKKHVVKENDVTYMF